MDDLQKKWPSRLTCCFFTTPRATTGGLGTSFHSLNHAALTIQEGPGASSQRKPVEKGGSLLGNYMYIYIIFTYTS